MLNYKPSETHVDLSAKLDSSGPPTADHTLYCSLDGVLKYLTFTRPDTSYAVQRICLFMHDPREPHFIALKCILCYIRGTTGHSLQFFSSPSCDIIAYSDADWAGYPVTHDLHSDIVSFGDTTCCLGHQNIRISFLGLVSKPNIGGS